ncbi:MAG: hypothetical protein ACJAWL_002564 [Motiliproteus sp.]|jgi:hypothetical protein
MLRWSFLILLLLNGLLYGWFYQERAHRRSQAERIETQAPGVAGLDLLREVPAAVLRQREPQGFAAAEAQPERALYCYRVGPFAKTQGSEARLGEEGPLAPSSADRGDARTLEGVTAPQALHESMRAVGLQGWWLEAAGTQETHPQGVSEERASAEALGLALQQQGYDAVVQEQLRYRYNYYLLLRASSESVAGSIRLQSLLKTYSAVETEKKLCQRLARTQGPE